MKDSNIKIFFLNLILEIKMANESIDKPVGTEKHYLIYNKSRSNFTRRSALI